MKKPGTSLCSLLLAPFLLFGIVPLGQAALNIAVQANAVYAAPGEAVDVEIIVTNTGGSPESNLSVSMPYPAGMNFIFESVITGPYDFSSCGSNFCSSGDVLFWNLGTMGLGQAITFSLPAIVADATSDGTTVDWEATLLQSASVVTSSTSTVTVDSDAPLTLAVDQDQNPVASDTELTYTVRYGNTGTSSVTVSSLSFSIPANSSFVSATGGGVFSGGQVSWNLGTLPAGSSRQQRVIVTVDSGLASGSLVTSQADITGTYNFLATLQQATEFAYVAPAANTPLALSVDVISAPAAPGEFTDVELTVTNTTAFQVFGGTLSLRYPQGANFIFESVITGPYDFSSCGSNFCSSGDVLTWNLGTMNPGQAITVSLPSAVHVDAPDGSGVRWKVLLSEDNGSLRSDSTTVQVDSDSALTIAIDEDSDPVPSGDNLTYTVNYGNSSAGNATNTNLSFAIPGNGSFVSATGGGSLSGGVVSWNLGTLPAGAVAQQRVVVAVDAGLDTGTLLESEAVISGSSNFLPTVRRATETTYVAPNANTPLALSVDLWPAPAQPGQFTNVELTVTNTTPFQVFGATLALRYPDQVNFVFENAISGPYDSNSCSSNFCDSGNVLSWNLGTMNPGQAIIVSLPSAVSPSTADGSAIKWKARLSEDNRSLRTESVTLQVDSDPALTIAIDESMDPIPAGANLTYTLGYGNRSAASVTMAQMSFPIPANSSFVMATGGGVFLNGSVHWMLGTIPAGGVAREHVVVNVNGGLDNGTLVQAEAEISGTSNFLPTLRRTSEVTYVTPSANSPLSLILVASPQPALADDTLAVELVVTNTSSAQVLGGLVQLRYPVSGVDFIFESDITGPYDFNSCGSNFCDSGALLKWNLGTMEPGATVPLSLPPDVASGLAKGNLINWRAQVTEDNKSLRSKTFSLLIGDCDTASDTDCDGVPDTIDNCTLVSNATQCDSDGDDYGNHCDADFNNDLITNGLDVGPLKAAFGTADPVTDLNCDGIVNGLDIGPLKAMFGTAPGPSGLVP